MVSQNSSPQTAYIISQFNDGCNHFQIAIQKVQDKNFQEFENNLRNGGMFIFNSLELGIKDFLSFYSKNPSYLHQFSTGNSRTNFHDLLRFMEIDGIPPLDNEISKKLNFYRNKMRNPTEHQGDIPSVHHMNDAISIIRTLLLTYLPITQDQLSLIQIPNDVKSILESEKNDYFQSISQIYEYMDLGGISPRVGNKVVKIRLDDLFIPLRMEENTPLIESIDDGGKVYSEKTIEKGSPLSPKSCEGKSKKIELLETKIESQKNQRSVTLNQILEKSRIVLLGHPGSGKTTVGKFIAYSIATKKFSTIGQQFEPLIPICIKVSDYSLELKNNQNLSLFDFIVSRTTSRYSKLFDWYLKNGLSICIIDGLDEVPVPQLQSMVIRRIEHFISEFNNNRFLITSRIVGYRKNQISGDFSQVTLVDFDDTQITHFLRKWHTAIEIESGKQGFDLEIDEKVKKLLGSIKSNIGIRKLAGNPLLLTIIALVNYRGTKLPNRRVDLYQIASETLIENWPLRQRQLKLDSNEIFKILEPIAFTIFTSGKNNLIHEQELMPLFEENVIEQRGISSAEAKIISKELFDAIEEGTGFFLARGLDTHHKKMFGFLHLTFAEYLTARYVAEQWLAGNFDLKKYSHDDRWHEIILLMAGHFSSYSQETASKLVKEILSLNSDHEKILHRDLLLSAEILMDNVKIKRELEDEIISRLIKCALTTENNSLFYYIIKCVARISKHFPIGLPNELMIIHDFDDFEIKLKKSLLLSVTGKISKQACNNIIEGLIETERLGLISSAFFMNYELIDISDKNHDNFIIYLGEGPSFMAPLSIDLANLFIESSSKIINFEQLIRREKNDQKTFICIIKPDDIASLDIQDIDRIFENTSSFFYSLIFSTMQDYNIPLIDLKEFTIKIIKSLSEINDIKSISQRLEMLQICFIFPKIIRHESDPEINLLLIDLSKKLLPAFDKNPECSEIVLRFIYNNCEEKRNLLFLKFITHSDEEVRVHALSFIDKQNMFPEITEKLNDCFFNDPSPFIRYVSAYQKIENDIFLDTDLPKMIDTIIQWALNEHNKKFQIQCLKHLINLSQKISQKSDLKNIYDDLNEKIFNSIKQFSKEEIDPVNYQYIFFETNEILAKKIRPLISHDDVNIQKNSMIIWSKIRHKDDLFIEFITISRESQSNLKLIALTCLNVTDLKDQNILYAVIDLMFDIDEKISEAAASKLQKIKSQTQRNRIILRIQEKEPELIERPACFSILWEYLVLPHLEKFSKAF